MMIYLTVFLACQNAMHILASVIKNSSYSRFAVLFLYLIMRKTCLYWSPKQVVLLQSQLERLKLLTTIYPELIVSETVPSKFSPREEYIRLTSSEYQPVNHLALASTIVYCMKLDEEKKLQIQRTYEREFKNMKVSYMPQLHITNNFSEVIRSIIKQLGYEEPKKDSISSVSSKVVDKTVEQLKQQQNRFKKQEERKKQIKNTAQIVLRSEFLNYSNVREASKVFKLDIGNIEKCQIGLLAQSLQKQLKDYLKSKNIDPIDKQFTKIRQSKTLTQLCRACLHFYTLQKHNLYQNLNFLLRNIRSIVFREQLQKLKLFAFLLILNYLYAYSGDYSLDQHMAPPLLYRYTDALIDPQLVGQIVTIPSFYSVSAKQDISSFKKKQTKIIIHPLIQGKSSISVSSLFPIYFFSAFRKEEEYLFLPFTCFLVTQIRYKKSEQKWIVDLKEVPGNPIIKKIFDLNLLDLDNYGSTKDSQNLKFKENTDNQFTSEWQLKCQQRYESSNDTLIKIKTSFNIGLIFLRLLQKYELAINYILQGLDLIGKLSKIQPFVKNVTTLKGLNYLGLAYVKAEKYQKAKQVFTKAEKHVEQLIKLDKNKQSKTNMNQKNKIADHFLYLSAALKNNQSLLCQAKQQFSEAVNKYKEALLLLQKCEVKNQLMEACIKGNIGISICREGSLTEGDKQNPFIYLKDAFVQCLKVYGIALSIQQQSPNKENNHQNPQKYLIYVCRFVKDHKILVSQLVSLLQNCSQVYELSSKLPKSIEFQQSAINLYKQLNLVQANQSTTLMYMRARLAKLLMKQEKYGESIKIYQQLLPMARLVDETGVKSAIFKSNIASALVNKGSNEDLERAVWWYGEAIGDISAPLLSENLDLYNKLCDLRKDISGYLKVFELRERQT